MSAFGGYYNGQCLQDYHQLDPGDAICAAFSFEIVTTHHWPGDWIDANAALHWLANHGTSFDLLPGLNTIALSQYLR